MDDTYSIVENIEGCNGFAVIDEDGDLKGCFNDKAGAERFIQAKQQDDIDDDMLDDNTFAIVERENKKSQKVWDGTAFQIRKV